MVYVTDMRRYLEAGDADGARRLWAYMYPGLPQPKSDDEALVVLHMARTVATSIALKLRAYSHRWLLDHNFPSQLPDELKPAAERMYPKVVTAVGISVNTTSELLRPAMVEIHRAMEVAVLEAYGDAKENDIPHIRNRMKEARERAVKALNLKVT
jgi:hypothetical protein